MSKGSLGLLSAYWPEDTPRYAHIPLKTIADVTINPVAASAPDRPAMVSASGTLTYGELAEKVRRFAEALRGRCERGTRVAIALADPAELMTAAMGAFEAEMLAFVSAGEPNARALGAFAPELIIGTATLAGKESISFAGMLAAPGKERIGRPDFKTPVLALSRTYRGGEVLHSHRTLAATAIAVGAFYMLAEDSSIVLLEPPTAWHTLALMLGSLHRGGTAWAACGRSPYPRPDRADYVVCSWDGAARFLEEGTERLLPARIGAGAIVAIEGPFSLSRRRRLARRFRTPVLTLLGRNDWGPVVGSHPTWFLDDAAGIPLPNVDTRPLNPADRTPLSLGWDSVEQAELGVKSPLAPAGGDVIEGWLQTGIVCEVDPTGLYFLHGAGGALSVVPSP